MKFLSIDGPDDDPHQGLTCPVCGTYSGCVCEDEEDAPCDGCEYSPCRCAEFAAEQDEAEGTD